ncbi:MAG: hypothetical protein FWE59_03175 [Oscillospiraceae bacterium]|nr:hypothetical protein [Oscillospiraceae bacterium]
MERAEKVGDMLKVFALEPINEDTMDFFCETIDDQPYAEGLKLVRAIVEKRASLTLFAPGTLDMIIEKSGGSLRDVFAMIMGAARLARRRDDVCIHLADAQWAATELKSARTRCIEQKDYQMLADIHKHHRTEILDKSKMLEMMQGMVVLEYNGDSWHDVHPLVADFLRSIGRLS